MTDCDWAFFANCSAEGVANPGAALRNAYGGGGGGGIKQCHGGTPIHHETPRRCSLVRVLLAVRVRVLVLVLVIVIIVVVVIAVHVLAVMLVVVVIIISGIAAAVAALDLF